MIAKIFPFILFPIVVPCFFALKCVDIKCCYIFFLFSQCAFIPYGILALAHIGLLQCIEVLMFYPQLPLTYGQLGQCKLSRRTRT